MKIISRTIPIREWRGGEADLVTYREGMGSGMGRGDQEICQQSQLVETSEVQIVQIWISVLSIPVLPQVLKVLVLNGFLLVPIWHQCQWILRPILSQFGTFVLFGTCDNPLKKHQFSADFASFFKSFKIKNKYKYVAMNYRFAQSTEFFHVVPRSYHVSNNNCTGAAIVQKWYKAGCCTGALFGSYGCCT